MQYHQDTWHFTKSNHKIITLKKEDKDPVPMSLQSKFIEQRRRVIAQKKNTDLIYRMLQDESLAFLLNGVLRAGAGAELGTVRILDEKF